MNATLQPARAHGRATTQTRPDWPDLPLTIDPDTAHPRAVEMAQAMRAGATTFRDLTGEGFTAAEIVEHKDEAKALATQLSQRQLSPGADRLSEMIAKAGAAIPNRMPMPKGATETQAMVIAWNRYCIARHAFKLDGWAGQRERCIDLLRAYFGRTPAGEAVTGHVVNEAAAAMRVSH